MSAICAPAAATGSIQSRVSMLCSMCQGRHKGAEMQSAMNAHQPRSKTALRPRPRVPRSTQDSLCMPDTVSLTQGVQEGAGVALAGRLWCSSAAVNGCGLPHLAEAPPPRWVVQDLCQGQEVRTRRGTHRSERLQQPLPRAPGS